jgi:hypothetical protein
MSGDRLLPLADLAPDPGHETLEEDFAAYLATRSMWADTWTADQLEFGPDWPATGYGPGGAHTAGEWLLLGERMAADWEEAFDLIHAPVRKAA